VYSSRVTALVAICTLATAIGASNAWGAGTKGEPVFQGSLGLQSTSPHAKQLDRAQIALIRVGARTSEPSVVRQGLGLHTAVSSKQTVPALRTGNSTNWFGWTTAAIVGLVIAGIAGIGAGTLLRRSDRSPEAGLDARVRA
jgi:hypothetical protein